MTTAATAGSPGIGAFFLPAPGPDDTPPAPWPAVVVELLADGRAHLYAAAPGGAVVSVAAVPPGREPGTYAYSPRPAVAIASAGYQLERRLPQVEGPELVAEVSNCALCCRKHRDGGYYCAARCEHRARPPAGHDLRDKPRPYVERYAAR